jgi:Spy/CpxP family protein refolding chaperone
MMDKPWKLVLLLVGIFAAGAVSGGFVAIRFGHPRPLRSRGEGNFREDRLKMLTERLDLTTDQQDKLRPILRPYAEDLSRIRNSSIEETRRVLERMEQDIAAVLTPEQRVKFDQMNREMRERMQRLMKDRGPGGGPHPRDHGPDGPPPESPTDHPPEKPAGS